MSPLLRRSRQATGRKRGVHPLAIAMLAIGATVFVIYYAFHQGLPFVHSFTLHAYVTNSVAVRQDSPVRIAGIDVGAVQNTSAHGNLTEVNFTVDGNGQPIHRDATVRIRARLFLEGGYYLELDPGSPSAPILRDGDVIPPAQTSTPVQFYQVLSTFDIAARHSLETLLNTLNEGFSPNPGEPLSSSGAGGLKRAVPQLTPVLKDVAWITRGLHGTHAGDVETLLRTASDVTTTLARNSAQLADLITSLNATSSALAVADGKLAQTVSGLDQTLQVSPAALTALDRSLPPLARLAVTLDPSLKVAPGLLDGLTKAVTELAAIVAPAQRDRLLTSLKATFQQFPALLTQLGSLFPITQAVTDCLSTHVTPTLQKVVPDGSLSTGRPAWQDFVHFLPNIAAASGNFDANGPWVRLLAGAGTNTLSLGNLPIIGQLLGSQPPGGGSLQGARPIWHGELAPADFQPGAPCASQPVPSLASPTAAPDLRSGGRTPAATPLSLDQLRGALARAAREAKGAGSR